MLTPLATAIAMTLFLIIVSSTRYVSLGSVAATLALPPADRLEEAADDIAPDAVHHGAGVAEDGQQIAAQRTGVGHLRPAVEALEYRLDHHLGLVRPGPVNRGLAGRERRG